MAISQGHYGSTKVTALSPSIYHCGAMRLPPTIFSLLLLLATAAAAHAQTTARDRELAARFAPIFYQGIGDNQRSDYITNFDFDGDWRGDNNWDHVADKRFALKAYVYFSVCETPTHVFIHYAVFHARDYKGGTAKGRILSEVLREGANVAGGYDPTGLAAAATVAHENDMEGCLLVIEKQGNDLARARVAFVETVAHNKFLKYVLADAATTSPSVAVDGQRPVLYIEPKGHGIESYAAAEQKESQAREASKDEAKKHLVVYKFADKAESPNLKTGSCGYDLVPIETTLWKHAPSEANETYGAIYDYGQVTVAVVLKPGSKADHTTKVGPRGVAFLGKKGGQNIARPPWGWFDGVQNSKSPGVWFFDPAKTIKKDFKLADSFSTAYVRHPILGIGD